MSGSLYIYAITGVQVSPNYNTYTLGAKLGPITSYTLNGLNIVASAPPGSAGTYSYEGFGNESGPIGYGIYFSSGTEYIISNRSTLTTGGEYAAVYDPTGSLFAAHPCFVAGTLITTPRGDVRVEDLREGDEVTLARGGTSPIVWIGHRRVRSSIQPANDHAMPIRIRAGALGDSVPKRDLLVSPEHAMWVDDMLVPARHLLNGTSVVQEKMVDFIYYHIELPLHDVLLAEGTPAESWLDTGNRDMFENAPGAVSLRADMSVRDPEIWAEKACGELVEEGPRLVDLRTHLNNRALEIGFAMPALVDATLDALGTFRVEIPAGVSLVRLTSEVATPPGEQRRLGVAIKQMMIDGAAIPLDDPRLRSGFHVIESYRGASWRWTDGTAILAVGTMATPRVLEIDVSVVAAERIRRSA
jgi:hypothetical protein